MTRPGLPAAAALTAIAAWLSFSTLAVAADGARIGLLPLSLSALIFTLAAVAAVVALARAGASLAPFALLILVLLPWTPLPAPAQLLLWAGEVRWLIWMAVAVIACSTVARRFPLERLPAAVSAAVRQKPGACRWRAGVPDFRGVSESGVAVDPGRRRAALPRHHAEPAARWRHQDREQPPAGGLPGLLCRVVGAALHPARPQWRDLFDPCARPVGARGACVRDSGLSRRRFLAPVALGKRERACLAPGVARFGPPGSPHGSAGRLSRFRRRRSFTASRSIPTGLRASSR